MEDVLKQETAAKPRVQGFAPHCACTFRACLRVAHLKPCVRLRKCATVFTYRCTRMWCSA